MQSNISLRALPFSDRRTYMLAALFIAGNILLPRLCHLIPAGGATWLPIYFFTLVGAYLYGWRTGVLVAIASPLLNSMLWGMPAAAMLPAILMKSTLLALIAGSAAARLRRATLGAVCCVVFLYQVLGTLGEWAMCGSIYTACQDFRMGIPGMLLQIFGGTAVIRLMARYGR